MGCMVGGEEAVVGCMVGGEEAVVGCMVGGEEAGLVDGLEWLRSVRDLDR